MRVTPTLAALLLAATLSAQSTARVLDPSDPGREIQIHRVASLLPVGAATDELDELVVTLQRLVMPPLEMGEDIAPLGGDKIAVVARPEQQVWVQDALATLATPTRERVTLELVAFACPPRVYAELLQNKVAAAGLDVAIDAGSWLELHPPALVVPAAERPRELVQRLRAAEGVESLATSVVQTAPLTTTEVVEGRQIGMVRDYIVKHVAGQLVLDPEVGAMMDGAEWRVAATRLPDGRLGFWMSFEWRDVVEPVPDFVTSLAGSAAKITIQLPEWTEFGFEDRRVVSSGDAVVWIVPHSEGMDGGCRVVIARAR
jgi:hypothetical protein